MFKIFRLFVLCLTLLTVLSSVSFASPTFTVTSPSGTVGSQFNITATVTTSDSCESGESTHTCALNYFFAFVNGSRVLDRFTCEGSSCSLDYQASMGYLAEAAQGDHTLTFAVWEEGAGTVYSDSYPFTVDAPPSITLASPSGTVRGWPYHVTGTAIFPPTRSNIKGYLYVGLDDWMPISPDVTCTTEACSFDLLKSTTHGSHVVYVKARAINTAEVTEDAPFFLDLTPTIDITAPSGSTGMCYPITGVVTFPQPGTPQGYQASPRSTPDLHRKIGGFIF